MMASGKRRPEDRAFKYPAEGAVALPEVSLAGRGLSGSTPRGKPYWGPSLRTSVVRSDLWPPEPEDPQPLPSASSRARFWLLTPGPRAWALGPASWRWPDVPVRCASSAVPDGRVFPSGPDFSSPRQKLHKPRLHSDL